MRGIVGEERRGKEMDGCPLTLFDVIHDSSHLCSEDM
jgi:hypothetical protein